MPHTGHILHGRYAVVSCHVERPLDDDVWRRFVALQERPPGGFAIAALMRPPAEGENEERWLVRAREAQERAPFGLHTHWTAPDHARPTGGDPASLVREQGQLAPLAGASAHLLLRWRLVHRRRRRCGGRRPRLRGLHGDRLPARYLEPAAPHLQLEEPVWLELSDGRRLLEVPTTHSIGMLARGLLGPFRRQIVHAYFHDTDLLDWRRTAALRVGLRFLGLKQDGDGPRHASARLAAREDDVVRKQPCMKRHEPSRDEMQVYVLEAVEEGTNIAGANICRCVGSFSGLCPRRKRSLFFRR